MGFRNIGFIEDKPTRWTSDLDILGSVTDLPVLIDKYNIDHVFICLPMNRYHEARRVFDVLSANVVDVRLVADVPNLAGALADDHELRRHADGRPAREPPLRAEHRRQAGDGHRAVVVGAIVLSPLMLAIAAIVKLTSPGPVFYRQERCGLNGRSFQMLKFRSMR